MSILCETQIKINSAHIASNGRTSNKYLKSNVVLLKHPNSEAEYNILHFSSVNRSGTKYRVKNIKHVFVKFINDGKSTIRFEDPPHDLCIKCNSIELKCFMRKLKLCMSGDAKALGPGTISSLSVTSKDHAPTKLIIRDRSEIPSKGLPRTLESLYMSGLKLCNFRRGILLLKHLTVLDLSNNEMVKIPSEFGTMPCLKELNLSHNQLGIEGDIDWRWLLMPQISKTLKLLDLSSNKLGYLPKAIWKLRTLVTLNLNDNELKKLPTTLGRIRSLRYLRISQNNLESLPLCLTNWGLAYLDISANKFQRSPSDSSSFSNISYNVNPNLVTLASKVVIKQNLFYAPHIIPQTLVEFLDNVNTCLCGGPVFNNESYFTMQFDRTFLSSVELVHDNTSRSLALVGFTCSDKCCTSFKNTF